LDLKNKSLYLWKDPNPFNPGKKYEADCKDDMQVLY